METTITPKMKANVIYKAGEMGIQTDTYFDAEGVERCNFSGYLRGKAQDLTVSEYLAENPGCTLLSWDNALAEINHLEDINLIKPFSEITEEEWTDALECLPPQKWETVDGVNIFRMSEYTTGNITCHYARTGKRYFSANRRTSTPYAEIAKEIKAIA